jgi:hypothetical protein
MAHSTGKTMVNNVLSMDKDDVATFEKLRDLGVKFDVRKVPNDSKKDLFELINKFNNRSDKSINSTNDNSIERNYNMSDMYIYFCNLVVVIVAFFAGLEGILDEFQFHQPLGACTLIGLVTGNLSCRCHAWWFSTNDCPWLG